MPIREFSDFERKIITKLINGANLPHLWEEDFRKNTKILVTYHEKPKVTRFEMYSSTYSSNQVLDTLTDTIDLLIFLIKNGLVRRNLQPVTSLGDVDEKREVSLGDGEAEKSVLFIVPTNMSFYGEFIIENENNIFRATEPLRVLASESFITHEERRHNEVVRNGRLANLIAVVTSIFALIGLGLTAYFTNNTTIQLNKQSFDSLLFKTGQVDFNVKNSRIADSINYLLLSTKLERQGQSLDSLKRKLKTVEKRLKK